MTKRVASTKVHVQPDVYMIDTPGIFLPEVKDPKVGMKLALCGSIKLSPCRVGSVKDSIVGEDEIADYLLFTLNHKGNFSYVEKVGLKQPTDELTVLIEAMMARFKKDALACARRFIRMYRDGAFGLFLLDDVSPVCSSHVATNTPIPSVSHARGQDHRRVLHRRADVVENEARHERQLRDLRENHQRAGEVLAQEAPAAVQLLPAAQPEQQVQELRRGHGEHEVRREGLDHAALRLTHRRIAHAVLLEHVQLRVDGDALQVHGDGPEQVAVAAGAVRADDEGEDDRGDDEVQRGVLLGQEEALAEGVVVGVVRVLQRDHDEVDVEEHHQQRQHLHRLVEPVSASRREEGIKEKPIQRQVAAAIPDSDGAAEEDNGVALERLQRDAARGFRGKGSEQNEAEAKTADEASQRLFHQQLGFKTDEKEGKISVGEEVVDHKHSEQETRPNQVVHAIRLQVALEVAIRENQGNSIHKFLAFLLN